MIKLYAKNDQNKKKQGIIIQKLDKQLISRGGEGGGYTMQW